eukprot:CAMPEP_0115576460 /NCGR_PEP_ID=MMETSP0272-20121206/2569_1 /TAXON_ID=71861 /ORGANISM="Scrippsiella trochoidea, Strain CCMP3099" /LENGTH=102 /DNA_ID=CAMNT_0003011243 /DNA_START=152 /DNA_END=457 /DNA_ORIENTATION=-
MTPKLDYLRLTLHTLTLRASLKQAEQDLMRIERLRQYRRIHDGDMSAELWAQHGGVPDDFLVRVRLRSLRFQTEVRVYADALKLQALPCQHSDRFRSPPGGR